MWDLTRTARIKTKNKATNIHLQRDYSLKDTRTMLPDHKAKTLSRHDLKKIVDLHLKVYINKMIISPLCHLKKSQ